MDISDAQLKEISLFTQVYQVSLGNVIGGKVSKDDLNETALTSPFPCTLHPSSFPTSIWNKVKDSTVLMNVLRNRVARDYDFIQNNLKEVGEVDELVAGLLKLHARIHSEGQSQELMLGIHRSDFMFHHDDKTDSMIPQQVEMNMISAGAGCQATQLCSVHEMLLDRYDELKTLSAKGTHIKSEAKQGLAKAMASAHKAQGKGSVILFVVQPAYKERNWIDQRHIEFELWKSFKIPVVRLTMSEVVAQCTIKDGNLVHDGKIISLVYFRAGYTPLDYENGDEWDARYLIEKSDAVKCPSVSYQLCGLKKIQQVLTDEKVLAKYLTTDEISQVASVCTSIYPLDTLDKSVIDDAIKNPHIYVMKSQREGGGNLIYGEKMVESLKTLTIDEGKKYLLMKRIIPKGRDSILLRDGKITRAKTVNELGIFAFILSDEKSIFNNEYCGYLLRTKREGVEDGSVLSGIFHLDSIILTNN